MMAEASLHFQDLLERLAAEHDREIRSLQAEIARLHGHTAPDAPELPGRWSKDVRRASLHCFQEKHWLDEARSDESSAAASGPPDEEALAAAFAVADAAGAESSWSVSMKHLKNSTTSVGGTDHEALALWSVLVQHTRRQVLAAELPKVHESWAIDPDADFGHKMKNLVVNRRTNPFMSRKRSDENTGGRTRACLVRTCIPRVPTHPSSKPRLAWDFVGILLLLHDLVMIPMSMFNSSFTGLPAEYERFLGFLDYFSASFWTCDVVMNFFTGYHATSGSFVEMDLRKIAVHYLQTWFPMDLCIVGIDWTMTILNHGGPTDFMRLGKTASRLTRLVRLLRFMKMNKHLSELMARINSEYVLTVIGLVKLVVWIVIVNHYIACFWFGLSSGITDTDQTWVSINLVEKGKSDLAYCYTSSLHWSLTQFTPASMEVVPQNAYERAFNVVVIICGFVIFSSFVSSITGAMNHIRNINARALEQDAIIRQYFSENNIHHTLASKVWTFVRQKRVSGKRLRIEELPILQQLPLRIRDELRQEMYTPHLIQHPILRVYSRLCPSAIRKVCITALSEVSLLSGKELKIPEGGTTNMIFVLIGCLEYHLFTTDGYDDEECPRVESGGWACEAAIWADSTEVDGHFIAAPGGADLLLLNAEAFRSIAREYADGLDVLVKYSKAFMARFAAAMLEDDITFQDNILFNNIEIIKELSSQAEGHTDASPLSILGTTLHPAAEELHENQGQDVVDEDEKEYEEEGKEEQQQEAQVLTGKVKEHTI
mmetsp:Transcript_93815/g.280006  ORF Transcript_93815/g.280006 Transcript_93815/m.280006 type:complete len:770 (-) Transcript_93815:26-2335(-)